MTNPPRIKFTHLLNGPDGNPPAIIAHAVAEVIAHAPAVRNRPGFNQTVWQGRASYLVNHIFNRNLVCLNTSVDTLILWLEKAKAEGKVASL